MVIAITTQCAELHVPLWHLPSDEYDHILEGNTPYCHEQRRRRHYSSDLISSTNQSTISQTNTPINMFSDVVSRNRRRGKAFLSSIGSCQSLWETCQAPLNSDSTSKSTCQCCVEETRIPPTAVCRLQLPGSKEGIYSSSEYDGHITR